MIYAKIEVILPRHHRMQAIDRASSLGVYVAMICHTREFELDGFVPAAALRGFPSHSKKDVDELLRVGLVEETEQNGAKGYRIVKYAEKNETKEDIIARRAATLARVTKHRNGVTVTVTNGVTNGERNGFVPDSVSVFGFDPEGGAGGSPDAVPEESGELSKAAKIEAAIKSYKSAYVRGVIAGKGSTYSFPDKQWPVLARVLDAHCRDLKTGKKLRGTDVIEWIEAVAENFAASVIESKDPNALRFGFGPTMVEAYLNRQHERDQAKAAP